MAKSKSFFGLRRGSTKSLTFQVLDGQQITKDRVTEVRNPKTNAQMYQRAIMATILQAYAAGKRIFDHSFQGKAAGAACQREFMSLNAKMLRQAVAYDIANNLIEKNVTARCVMPGASSPVPNGYIISKGSLQQNFFVQGEYSFRFVNPEAGESCAAYCQRNGLIPGDIYTIVAFFHPSGDQAESWAAANSTQKKVLFGYIRMQVKDSALTDSTQTGASLATFNETPGVPFVITDTLNHFITDIMFDGEDGMIYTDLFNGKGGSIGIIRSRFDQDLRSDCTMFEYHLRNDPAFYTGLANPYILPRWKAGSEQIGDSDLILEGGNF